MKQLILFLCMIILAGCFGKTPQKTGNEGKPMPDFTLLLTDSTSLSTHDIPPGKPVVLFYFSPYCPYCEALTLELLEEMDDLRDIRFYFVTSYGWEHLETFKKEHQLAKFPNVTIGIDTALFIRNYFKTKGVPYTAIFNKNKILNNCFLGEISAAQLKNVADN